MRTHSRSEWIVIILAGLALGALLALAIAQIGEPREPAPCPDSTYRTH